MARVATLVNNQILVDRMMTVRKRVDDAQVQVSTNKKSQNYAGVAFDSLRLVSFENQRTNLNRYVENNTTAQLRLKIQETQVTSVEKAVTKFRSALVTFSQLDLTTVANPTQEINNIQTLAFNAMKDVEFLLNTRVDGRYLFAGGKTDVKPVDFAYTSVSGFQTTYPGTGADFPVTRAQQLGNTSLTSTTFESVGYALSNGASTITATPSVTNATFGTATFASGTSTITAGTANGFSSLAIGSKFTVAGSASNNTTFTVISNDGTTMTVYPAPTDEAATAVPTITPRVFAALPIGATITIAGATTGANDATYTITANTGNVLTVTPAPAATEALPGGGTISATLPNNYYDGDQMQLAHRVDEDRTITLGINATDGAFEKAFRAMGMVAQGDLLNNSGRVRVAINLLGDSLQHSASALPNESTSGIVDVQNTLGRNAVILDDTNKRHQDYMTFLDSRTADMENIDPLEAITRLQSDSNTLEIAMKTLARISDLSLSKYI
ncbi:MAG: hypothetical protein HQL34_01645 [Alphaproteobacteria bacterium]|nr:hypothetical protein [Alphaproteobacteria bacterium]